MRTPKTLKIAEIQARHIAVDWESLGYNITRCHTFNVTICYHYFCGHNESKADCLDMDPKAPQHVVDHLPPYTNVSLKMILTNPEGRKESEETIIQTDEDGMCKCCYENYIQGQSRQVEGDDFVCYNMCPKGWKFSSIDVLISPKTVALKVLELSPCMYSPNCPCSASQTQSLSCKKKKGGFPVIPKCANAGDKKHMVVLGEGFFTVLGVVFENSINSVNLY